MTDKILDALRAEGIDAYAINEVSSRSVECFFVRRNMDLKRRTDIMEWTVTVYREIERSGERLLGSSSLPVYPGMGEGELRAALRDAYYAASLAGNQYYELLEGTKEPEEPSKSGFASMEPEEAAKLMGDALFAADVEEDVFVNSAELFVLRRRNRVINSRGVDVSWNTDQVRGEFVIQCPAPRDVETYHSFAYRDPDAGALTEKVRQALSTTRDRAAAAQPPKSGEYTVILTGEQLEEVLSCYLSRSDASLIYQHYSDYAPGMDIQGQDATGDRLTIDLSATVPYDSEGVRLTDRRLMEDGVLRCVHGGVRFSRYLGVEPTGKYTGIVVPTGETPLAQLKAEPYLETAIFSDFQMNPMTGHFAGEIRLGYLFDGEKVTPVTGGSINGSLFEAQKTMRFSKERFTSASYHGPYAVALKGVRVAGVE